MIISSKMYSPKFKDTFTTEKFKNLLLECLIEESVFDTEIHSVEDVILPAILLYKEKAIPVLKEMCFNSMFSSDIIKCISRMPLNIIGYWAHDIMREVLESNDIQIRKSAVDALKEMDSFEAMFILQDHKEKDKFLKAHIKKVLDNFKNMSE